LKHNNEYVHHTSAQMALGILAHRSRDLVLYSGKGSSANHSTRGLSVGSNIYYYLFPVIAMWDDVERPDNIVLPGLWAMPSYPAEWAVRKRRSGFRASLSLPLRREMREPRPSLARKLLRRSALSHEGGIHMKRRLVALVALLLVAVSTVAIAPSAQAAYGRHHHHHHHHHHR
jgi:hypothetical protein